MCENNGHKIKLRLGNWIYNAGVLGFLRILNNHDYLANNSNEIEIPIEELENFGDKYFKYFRDKYEKDLKLTEIFKEYDKWENYDFSKIDELSKEDKKKIKSSFSKFITKFKTIYKSCKDTFQILKKIYIKSDAKENNILWIKEYKDNVVSRKDKEDYTGCVSEIRKIYHYLKENENHFFAENISNRIISSYIQQLSFLDKQNRAKERKSGIFKSYFESYNESFVKPIKRIEVGKNNIQVSCHYCGKQIKTVEDKLENFLTGFIKMSRPTPSAYWGFNYDVFACPICRLIFSCVPAGFTNKKGKGLFININRNIQELNRVNDSSNTGLDNKEDIENISYYQLLNIITQNMQDTTVKNEISNIQVIRNDGGTYSFNQLSGEMLEFMRKNAKLFNTLSGFSLVKDVKVYISPYKEVVDAIFNGRNLYPLIDKFLRMSLEKGYLVTYTSIINSINLKYLEMKREVDMENDKYKFLVKSKGEELRKAYSGKENKINGIAYKLLNSLRTRNENQFMDVLLNCYMYHGRPVPDIFTKSIGNTEKFLADGYTFMIGFLGGKEKLEEANSKNNSNGEESKDEE